MSQPRSIEFLYDVVCPFAYIASKRVEAVAANSGASVIWKPVLLGGIYESIAAPQGKNGSASDVMSKQRKVISAQDIRVNCKRYNVTINWHPKHPVRSVNAQRLLCAAPDQSRAALSHALYDAYWVHNDDVSDTTYLLQVAAKLGLKFDEKVFEAEEHKEKLRRNTADAVKHGAPGVPGFVVGDRFFWGSDRLHFVDRALGNPRAAQFRLIKNPAPSTKKRTLTFYFDFSSPWSFLGNTQVERVVREAGPHVTLEAVPILLGALFKEIGTANVPMLTFSKQKSAYVAKDMTDWQDWWEYITGKSINLHWPSKFPIRSVLPLRVAICEPKTRDAIYQAAWVQDEDVADPTTLTSVLNAAGFDGAALIKAADSEQAKKRLIENTTRATAAGVCGVPSFQIDGGFVIWGQDRYDVVADVLAGWHPDIEHTEQSKL